MIIMKENSIQVLKTLHSINETMENDNMKGITIISDLTHESITNVGVQYSDELSFKDKTVMIRTFIDNILNIDCDTTSSENKRIEFLKIISPNIMETKDINDFKNKYL